MDSPVQQIKERLGIEEIVTSYLKLERAGANLKARCPFHNEKTPSFFVSPGRGSYYCFGCGASGDIFTFVEEFEGLDFKGALKLLAARAGVELGNYNKEAESEKEKLYRVMEETAKFFAENLSKNPPAREYLLQRGLTEKSIDDFELGYALAGWRDLYQHLSQKGFADAVVEQAGLIKKTDKGYYDRFRGRIMFPIWDSSGRTVAFSGRIFEDDGKSAKYVNSPETPIFHKSSVLYGIDRAKDSIRKSNFSILVEGQMDLILSHQAGYRNAVAASGTALSDSTVSKENAVSNIGLVRRLSQNIVLALDGDQAGIAATLRAGKIALALGMDVKVARMPEDFDPADLIQKKGAEAWKDAIKNSRHIVEFVLGRVIEESRGDARKAGRDINEKVLPFVSAIGSSVEQAHFLKKISDTAGIPLQALEEDFKKIDKAEQKTAAEWKEAETEASARDRKDYIKRRLLGIILWQRTLKEATVDSAKILNELSDIFRTPAEKLLEDVKNSTEDLIFEAEIFYSQGMDPGKDAVEMLRNAKEEALKEELAAKMQELYRAETEKDRDKAARIFKECQELSQIIEDFKNGRIKN